MLSNSLSGELHSFSPVGSTGSASWSLYSWSSAAFILVAALLYGMLFGLAVIVEVSYDFDRYGGAALAMAPLATFWITGTTVGALILDTYLVRRESAVGLLASAVVMIMAAFLLLLDLFLFLPSNPTVQAQFQTYTAQAGYLKALWHFLPIGVVGLAVPFHYMTAVEYEIQNRRLPFVRVFASLPPTNIPASGAPFLPPWVFSILLTGLAAVFILGNAYLFANLTGSPYMNLFMTLVLLRMGLSIALGLFCLGWYIWRLAALREQCKALVEETQA